VSWLDRGLALAAGLALLATLAVWWHTRRELGEVRQKLEAATAANVFLKKTLGDMTIAITAKDREIDRLEQAPCNGREKAGPGSTRGTDRSKASASSASSRGNRGTHVDAEETRMDWDSVND
jgi:hypothetical protein